MLFVLFHLSHRHTGLTVCCIISLRAGDQRRDKRQEGKLLLSREPRRRGCRVTYTCARSTCPDRIHLHTKTHSVHLTQHVGHCEHTDMDTYGQQRTNTTSSCIFSSSWCLGSGCTGCHRYHCFHSEQEVNNSHKGCQEVLTLSNHPS